jgi:hypothetical protein
MRLARRDRGLALGLAAGGLALLVWLVPTAPLTGDGEHYVAFARSHLQHGAASALHARRILEPAIVAGLPLDPLLSFHALTIASLFVAALLTWSAARSLGVSGVAALTSIVFFLGTWAVAPNLREYALVDPMAWAFVAAIWLAIVQRRWRLAAALGAVGVLAKEVVVATALVAAAASWSPGSGWKGVVRAGAVAAPAVFVLGALQVLLPGSGTDNATYLTKWWVDGLGSLGPARVGYLVLASYGALWLLVPKGFPRLTTHVRTATFVTLCGAVVLPAVGSPERMEELIFPAVITAAVEATRVRGAGLAFALGAGNALFVARVGGDAQIPPPVAWLGLLVAVGLALVCYVPQRKPWYALAAFVSPWTGE